MTQRHGVKKTLQSDSTALINSLLRSPKVVSSEAFTNAEKIEGGLFQIVDGPLKILYGSGLMVSGFLLTFIPGVIINVKTSEIEDANGLRATITGVRPGLRIPKTPLNYKRTAINGNRVTEITGFELKFHIVYPDPHKNETLPHDIQTPYVRVNATTSVTGYGLFTTGLGRVVAGIFDPIEGTFKAVDNAIRIATS
jgi:hypothetical protein